ncbi:CopD family protein [Comamonas faecalis]|uniref:CopD family protein n=2 Tax=Comamonas faecalis TaxID=1387849 RepID=A0ABP7S4K9_9BURK
MRRLWHALPGGSPHTIVSQMYNLLKFLHVLSIVAWVGGLFFAVGLLYPALRPLAEQERVASLARVMQRFLPAVAIAALLALLSGLGMIGMVSFHADGGFRMPLAWTLMSTLGLVMMALLVYQYFGLFDRLEQRAAAGDWAAAASVLARLRTGLAITLALGVATVAVVFLA